ncbi:site-specific integrase [Streptomyces sp. NPDC048385]|uniref:tyrosine-type recombinase/integrase n=2 Tax=Streptomyces TaxID=1883 RepID=UPI0034359E8B
MILHFFSSAGWESWDLPSRPLIRHGMPVLVDEDLRFEDEDGPRPTVAMNRWLQELPITGAPSPNTWRAYAQQLKSWSEFLTEHSVGVFADQFRLRGALSAYAEHRLSGPLEARLEGTSWNLAVKTIAAFYEWSVRNGHCTDVPFSYTEGSYLRPDGARMQSVRNLATVRGAKPHATRKYLERPFAELLMNALAGNDPDGEPDHSFRGRETGRNTAGIGLALSTGLRLRELSHLTVWEIPPLPRLPTTVPVPLQLAPPTAKGGKGRQTWIDYEALARVHDYVTLERAASVDGSRWLPRGPLYVEEPTYAGASVNGTYRQWHVLTPDERRRLVAPGGGSALLAVQSDGSPFVDWATVLRRTSARVRDRFDPAFPHVFPHMTRHTFAMATLERLVRGYYQRAAQLVMDTDGDNAMALYLTKADPLLVLRDLMGHASVATTQAYLHLLDTQRIFREAYEETSPTPREQIEAATEFEDSDAR